MPTEYKRTFQDFTGRTSTQGSDTAVVVPDGATSCPTVTRAHTWYSQLQELRRNAITYKVRNWGKETAPDHLVYLYERAEDPHHPPERKIISALYLETLQPEITRADHDRKPSEDTVDSRKRAVSAGASNREKVPPPVGAGHARAKDKTGLRLHMNEKRTRPGGAQPVTAKSLSIKSKGRSPSAPRPHPSQGSGGLTRSKSIKARRKSPGDAPVPVHDQSPVSSGVKSGTDAHPTDSGKPAVQGSGQRTAAAPRSGAERSPSSNRYTPDFSAASGPISIDSSFADSVAGLVKSPPMPTRVKSPEDVAALNSPEPVNWTLPLDTARAFAVTSSVPSGAHKSHSTRAKSRQSPNPGQISPLHKQLVSDQLARSSQPSVQARAAAAAAAATLENAGDVARQDTVNSVKDVSSVHGSRPGAAGAAHAAEAGVSSSSIPALVRPSQDFDRSPVDAAPSIENDTQQNRMSHPSGAPSFFSAGSSEPPPAAMVALFAGTAKPAQSKADGQANPVYRVI